MERRVAQLQKRNPFLGGGLCGRYHLLAAWIRPDWDNGTVMSRKRNFSKRELRDALEALWKSEKEVTKAHFSLRGFKNKTAATDLPMMPYHPVAIAFYKSKGIWKAKHDVANAAAMK